MFKNFFGALLFSLVLAPVHAACRIDANLYYINGVMNPSEFKVRREADRLSLIWNKYTSRAGSIRHYEAFHNWSGGFFMDVLYEFTFQKGLENTKIFIENFVDYGMSTLGHLGYLPSSEIDVVSGLVNKLNIGALPQSAMVDIDHFSAKVRNDGLLKDRQVILVAHSQGNMFANAVQDIAKRTMEARLSRGLGVVGVANPSSLNPTMQYMTIEEDWVIKALRLASPEWTKPLQPNFSAPAATGVEFLAHGFSSIYLSDSIFLKNEPDVSLGKALVRKIDATLFLTSTFWDAPKYTIDANGNNVLIPPNLADSSRVEVCFPGEVGV